MAQTKKKRRRKKRGTQAGSLDTRKRGRPRNRAEARGRAKSKGSGSRAPRADRPPSWKSATVRGVIAAIVFVALLMLLFGRTLSEALPIGLFLLVFYIPAGYLMDSFMWKRRVRAKIRSENK